MEKEVNLQYFSEWWPTGSIKQEHTETEIYFN